MNRKILVIIAGCICLFAQSCSNSKVQETNIRKQVDIKESPPIVEGTPMSDSLIKSIIKGSVSEAPQHLDLSQCRIISSVEGLQFTMDSIAKYHLQVDNYIESCLYQVDHGTKQSYIIFNNDIESHYSPYFKVLTLDGSDTIQMKTICQIYGNEQMDYVISAKGIGTYEFELKTDYTYVYVHGIGKVDSTRTEIERLSLQ